LLDDHAVLGTMVYVDLNPVRAGMTKDATKAKHTSLVRRMKEQVDRTRVMTAMSKSVTPLPFIFTLEEYIQLTEWTLDAQQAKRPTRFSGIPPSNLWVNNYLPKPGHWQRALGSIKSMKHYAKTLGLCWIRTRSAQYT